MILESTCSKRKCIHYIGISQPDGTEISERPICEAYPNGIPDDITLGDDLHSEVRDDQDNEIVFEKK